MLGLQKRLQRYFNLLNEDFSHEIKEIKKEMSVLTEIKSKGVILRSREREVEEGEKCTSHFFQKIMTKRFLITEMKEGNAIFNNTEKILDVIEDFYGDLYDFKDTNQETMTEVLDFLDTKIKDDVLLKGDCTLLELERSLKGFKQGKSPGVDGLPLEFYRTFYDILAHDLLTVFKEFDGLGRLPDSFRVGIVSFLDKKGDNTDVKNWRPITLLNFDCKIFSRLLARRMSTVLEDVIHPDQVCAVPGRRITDSLEHST